MDALLPIPLVSVLDKENRRVTRLVVQGSTSFHKTCFLIRGDFQKEIYYLYAINPILIKGYFQRFSNHAFHLLTYSVRSDSPQLFFQDLGSQWLFRLRCAGLILRRLYYVGIFDIVSLHNSQTPQQYYLYQHDLIHVYVFEMLYKGDLYFMHDLSWNWVCNEILYFENFMSLEMMLN